MGEQNTFGLLPYIHFAPSFLSDMLVLAHSFLFVVCVVRDTKFVPSPTARYIPLFQRIDKWRMIGNLSVVVALCWG